MIEFNYKDKQTWEIYVYYKEHPDEVAKLTYEEFKEIVNYIFENADERWKFRNIISIGEHWFGLDRNYLYYLIKILCENSDTGIWLVEAGEKWNIDEYEANELFDCITTKDDALLRVYNAGSDWDEDIFPLEKAMKFYEENDTTGLYTAKAGTEKFGWPEFDYEKGLEIILNNDKTGEAIYIVGRDWPKEYIDYDLLLDFLIQIDKNGKWIYKAGLSELGWPEFDYKKGYEALKKLNNHTWLKRARMFWSGKIPEDAVIYFY